MKVRDIIEQELREKTQTRLARDIGISQATIYKVLNTDTIPNIDTVKKIAKYSGHPITYFLELTDEPHGNDLGVSDDERKLLTMYRQLKALGVSQDAFNFLGYLLEKTRNKGSTAKKLK